MAEGKFIIKDFYSVTEMEPNKEVMIMWGTGENQGDSDILGLGIKDRTTGQLLGYGYFANPVPPGMFQWALYTTPAPHSGAKWYLTGCSGHQGESGQFVIDDQRDFDVINSSYNNGGSPPSNGNGLDIDTNMVIGAALLGVAVIGGAYYLGKRK